MYTFKYEYHVGSQNVDYREQIAFDDSITLF
jgi:hypothetical protein